MKTRVLSIVLACAVALAGCGAPPPDVKKTTTAEALGPQKVKVSEVVFRDFQPMLTSTGTLVPSRQAEIRALVEGRIDAVPVDIGTRVRRGQLLFEIRTADYRLALQQAEAALSRARVTLEESAREQKRMEGLFSEGSATEQMRDRARAAYEESQAALGEAEARRALAAQYLDDATVRAPYDGVITARFLQKGEYATKGERIVEIMDLSILNAEMEIPEPSAGEITTGMDVTVSVRSGAETFAGKVVAVNPKVDLETRTFKVKVEVDNAQGKLQANLFCTGTFRLASRSDVPAVPSEAVIRDEGRSIVWVVADGTARSRRIVEEGADRGFVFVREGLDGGEQVVIAGSGGLYDGAPVSVEENGVEARSASAG